MSFAALMLSVNLFVMSLHEQRFVAHLLQHILDSSAIRCTFLVTCKTASLLLQQWIKQILERLNARCVPSFSFVLCTSFASTDGLGKLASNESWVEVFHRTASSWQTVCFAFGARYVVHGSIALSKAFVSIGRHYSTWKISHCIAWESRFFLLQR